MAGELNKLILSIEKLKESNDSLLKLLKSTLSSDLDAEHKLVAITSILETVIKNQSFIFTTIIANSTLISDQNMAIADILNRIQE